MSENIMFPSSPTFEISSFCSGV